MWDTEVRSASMQQAYVECFFLLSKIEDGLMNAELKYRDKKAALGICSEFQFSYSSNISISDCGTFNFVSCPALCFVSKGSHYVTQYIKCHC